MDDRIAEKLLASLYAGRDLTGAARACDLSLGQAAQWSASRRGAEAIAALQRLAQARSSLVVCRARADAARALVKLARDHDAKETARKACVDLLRLDEAILSLHSEEAPALLNDADQRAWLAALERIGQPIPLAPTSQTEVNS